MNPHSFPVDSDPASFQWHEIEERLDELAALASSRIEPAEFYRAVLERIAPATGMSAGAVWTQGPRDPLRLTWQHQLLGPTTSKEPATSKETVAQHQTLAAAVLASGQPRVVQAGTSDVQLETCAVLQPFKSDNGTAGVIELVGRREISAATSRACLQVLAAVGELAQDYHKHQELAQLRAGATKWRLYDEFARRVHRSLEVRDTAYLIANDGRKLIGCDRASVLVRRGSKYEAQATSGVDRLDRRSKTVRALERLAAKAAASGEVVWYCDGTADMPDQISAPLLTYLDESHARVLALVPLREPPLENDSRERRVIGVFVAEQFQAAEAPQELRESVIGVAGHAEAALANALVHGRQPLAWLSRMLARVRWLGEPRQLPKTAAALAALAAVVAGLVFIPSDFAIEAEGEFQPGTRKQVFATDDGIVDQLLIDPGRAVQAGQPLLVLRNPTLELESRRISGEMQTAEKKLAAVRAERLLDAPVGTDERRDPHEAAAEEEQLKVLLAGLAEQQKILDKQRAELTIRSPIDGDSLTWDVKQLLEARPVERGQALVEVADLDGPWKLELHLADDNTGHVLAAQETIAPDLEVTFVLASDPGTKYRGRIADVAPSTQMTEAGEPIVLVTVDFDKKDVPSLRPGATALARIQCGRRSTGYVWLHDLFEYVQTLWW